MFLFLLMLWVGLLFSLGSPVVGSVAYSVSDLTVTNDAPALFPLGSTTVTWTVTDPSGLFATATQLVSVSDVAPSIAAPTDVSVSANALGGATVSLGSPVVGSVAYSVSDLTVTNDAPALFPLGSTTVTWTVTDPSGLFATATQLVSVSDVAPSIAAPTDVSVSANALGGATVSLGSPVVGSVAYSVSDLTVTNDAPALFPLGSTTVTWTVTDPSGLFATATQLVSVSDVAPSIAAPTDVSVSANALGGATVSLGSPVVGSVAYSVSDLTVTNDAPALFPLGSTTVTWTVTDPSGLFATATQLVSVSDVAPSIAAPTDVSVSANALGGATVSLGSPVVGSVAYSVSDLTVTNDAPALFPLGSTTVTWTVTDPSGLFATATQLVSVSDVAPSIAAPTDVSVSANALGGASGVALGTPSVSSIAYAGSQLTVANNAPSMFPLGSTTVTWTVTDPSGLYATGTQVVSVNAAALKSITVSLSSTTPTAGSAVSFSAKGYDQYGNAVAISPVWSVSSGSIVGNSVTENLVGTYTVTATAGSVIGQASFNVKSAALSTITISVSSSSVAAGQSETLTATGHDQYGNNLGPQSVTFTVNGASISGNSVTETSVNTYTVSISPITGVTVTTASFNVNPAGLDHLSISPTGAIIAAGNSESYTVNSYDQYNNLIASGVSATFKVTGASILGNSVTETVAGSYVVEADYNGKSVTTTLTVNPTSASKFMVSSGTSQTAGTPFIVTVTAEDAYGNIATSYAGMVSISSSDSAATLPSNALLTNGIGSFTITLKTAAAQSITATDTLISLITGTSSSISVLPATVDHITINPSSSTVAANTTQSYSIAAFDTYGNSLGKVTSATTFTASGATISGNTVSAANAGTYTVTATFNGKTATAILTVDAASAPQISTYNVTFTENDLPKGQTWGITFNGITESSTTNTIVFTSVTAGTYSWTTQTITYGADTRYIPSTTSGTINVPSDPTTTAASVSYTTQYYLTVNSEYGNPTGAGWYSAGQTATFAVTSPFTGSAGNLYTINTWTGTGTGSCTGSGATQSVTMNNPMTETATWTTAPSLRLYTVGIVAVIIFAIIFIAASLMTRRRRNQQNTNAN